MNEKLTEEELKMITDALTRRKELQQVAERAALEAKNAELAHQVTVQHVFLKYGLSFNDKIDDATGVITRAMVKDSDASEGQKLSDEKEASE